MAQKYYANINLKTDYVLLRKTKNIYIYFSIESTQ